MNLLDAVDLATRPIGVPLYLLAAWLSRSLVRMRSERPWSSPPIDGPVEFESVEAPTLSTAGSPTVTVVVPALNAEATLGRCLESIRRLDYPGDCIELIVADNASTDRTPQIAEEHGARVVAQPRRGASATRNAGIEAASHDLVALTDADCIAHPLWLKHLVASLRETGDDCAGVGGRIVNECRDSVVWEFACREAVFDQEAAIEGRLLPGPFVITCNSIFRREALQGVGGFDESFPVAGAEDADLGWRLTDRGFELAYSPGAVVHHRQRSRDLDIYAQYYRYGLSEVRLYLKHRTRFGQEELARYLWIWPVLYRNFWKALACWTVSLPAPRRRFWRLVVLKELGHMAGKLEGARHQKTWRHFRLWTHD